METYHRFRCQHQHDNSNAPLLFLSFQKIIDESLLWSNKCFWQFHTGVTYECFVGSLVSLIEVRRKGKWENRCWIVAVWIHNHIDMTSTHKMDKGWWSYIQDTYWGGFTAIPFVDVLESRYLDSDMFYTLRPLCI